MSRKTITDVAKAAGVAIKTVSRVLNNEPKVRASTRERVLAAVNELNYHPSLSARGLAGRRSNWHRSVRAGIDGLHRWSRWSYRFHDRGSAGAAVGRVRCAR